MKNFSEIIKSFINEKNNNIIMVLKWFKRLFKINQTLDYNQSNTQSINQSNTQSINQSNSSLYELNESSIELHKESVQLGLAAGFTGKSLQEISSSLNRIETLMASKDWLLVQLNEHFHNHEENEQRRLETILNALKSLRSISLEAPEPLKTKLLDKINDVESRLGLSNRMKELIKIIKDSGEISYSDLAQKMNLTESGLRSLLSITLKRTHEIEKFHRENRKWVRYKLKQEDLINQASQALNNQ